MNNINKQSPNGNHYVNIEMKPDRGLIESNPILYNRLSSVSTAPNGSPWTCSYQGLTSYHPHPGVFYVPVFPACHTPLFPCGQPVQAPIPCQGINPAQCVQKIYNLRVDQQMDNSIVLAPVKEQSNKFHMQQHENSVKHTPRRFEGTYPGPVRNSGNSYMFHKETMVLYSPPIKPMDLSKQ